MTAFLLDVNVLIALMDPAHVHHEAAHAWFGSDGSLAWATCPMTQIAVLRIVGGASYPNSPGGPSVVAPLLSQFCALPGHRFWPDDISALDTDHMDAAGLLTSSQVTDSYLLALARKNAGKLATFDRRLAAQAVPDGKTHLQIL
jgi:uncharacterized protein